MARFGGEEFIILLPSTPVEAARHIAERIRRDIAERDVLENGHRVTASFGIGRLAPGESCEALIRRADEALYRAKASGRNRTVLAS